MFTFIPSVAVTSTVAVNQSDPWLPSFDHRTSLPEPGPSAYNDSLLTVRPNILYANERQPALANTDKESKCSTCSPNDVSIFKNSFVIMI